MDRRIVIEAATNTKTIRTSRLHRIRGDNRRTIIQVEEGVAPVIMITRCTLEVNFSKIMNFNSIIFLISEIIILKILKRVFQRLH